jgi:pSer/pThr/pTyr-binding forkhead associated (FHA) protein
MAILAQLVDDVVVHKFEFTGSQVSLGRHPLNDLVIDDGAVSAKHARFFQKPNSDFPQYQEWFVEDLKSTNGTFVNDIKVEGTQRVHHGDIVRVAWNSFKLIDPSDVGLEETVHMIGS